MSTINPDAIRTDIPKQGSGDPQAPVDELSSDHRAQNTSIKTQFQAAKTDIEALESGKENVGVAASEVATHDGLAGAHGGHFQDTSNPHSTTAAQVGATPLILGNKGDVLTHDGAQHVKVAASGNADWVLTEDPAQPGGWISKALPVGGGGISKGTPFTVGDVLEVENAAGDGVARSTTNVARLTASNVFTGARQRISNSAVTGLELFQTGVTSQAGRWHIESANGFLAFASTNDAGTPAAANPEFTIAHDNFIAGKGAVMGAAAFQGHATLNAENGLFDGGERVYSPTKNPPPYDVAFQHVGDPPAQFTRICYFVAATAFTIPANFLGSTARISANAEGAAQLQVVANSVNVGTIDFSNGSPTGTFSASAETTVAVGHVFEVYVASSGINWNAGTLGVVFQATQA